MALKIALNDENYLYKNIVKAMPEFRSFCDNLDEGSKPLLSFIDFKAIAALEDYSYYGRITFFKTILACVDKKVVYHYNGKDYETTVLLLEDFQNEYHLTPYMVKKRYLIDPKFFTNEITGYKSLQKLSQLASDFEIKVVKK